MIGRGRLSRTANETMARFVLRTRAKPTISRDFTSRNRITLFYVGSSERISSLSYSFSQGEIGRVGRSPGMSLRSSRSVTRTAQNSGLDARAAFRATADSITRSTKSLRPSPRHYADNPEEVTPRGSSLSLSRYIGICKFYQSRSRNYKRRANAAVAAFGNERGNTVTLFPSLRSTPLLSPSGGVPRA